MPEKKAIIALNGELRDKTDQYLSLFRNQETLFIAADAGALLYEKLGIKPNIIIGDFDSLENKNKIIKNGVEIIEYPVDKDETDGELAIEYCIDNGIKEITIIGAFGGRYDHQLANIFLLEYAYYHQIDAVIKDIDIEIGLINDSKGFVNCANHILSLIPLDKKVYGVSIEGCKYNLDKADMCRFKSRGISNQILEEKALITVKKGLLLYIKTN
ncbi:MAG: thiamine diphosphokinase [Halanaerobiaceae bacterium]